MNWKMKDKSYNFTNTGKLNLHHNTVLFFIPITFLLLMFLLQSCKTATVRHSDSQLEQWVKKLQPHEDMALLYVLMEKRPANHTYKIYIDGKFWGEVGSGTFIAAVLPAGKLVLHTKFYWPEKNRTLDTVGDDPIILLPGETQYRIVDGAILKRLTEKVGGQLIKQSKLSAENVLMHTLQKYKNLSNRHQTERADSVAEEPSLYLDLAVSSLLDNTNLDGLLTFARKIKTETAGIGIRVDYGSISGRSWLTIQQEGADASFFSALDFERQLKEDYGGYPLQSSYRPIEKDKIFYADINPERLIQSGLSLFGGMPFSPTAAEHYRWLKEEGGLGMYQNALDQAGFGVKCIPCAVSIIEGFGWFKKPLEKPADLKDMSIHVEAPPLVAALMRDMGIKYGESMNKLFRAWLGVHVKSVIKNKKPPFHGNGALVVQIISGGPAEAAGIQVNDLIIGCDGKQVGHHPGLLMCLDRMRLNEKVSIDLIRDGKNYTYYVKPELLSRTIPWTKDINGLIQKGKINGIAIKAINDKDPWAQGVYPYYYYPGLQRFVMYDLIVKSDVWNKLSNRQRTLIEKICHENVLHNIQDGQQRVDELLSIYRNRGIHVDTLPDNILNAAALNWKIYTDVLSKNSTLFSEAYASYRSHFPMSQTIAELRDIDYSSKLLTQLNNLNEKEQHKGKTLPEIVKDVFGKSNSWAVVIGINNYQSNKGWNPLPYAINDAIAMKSYLIKYLGFSEEKVLFLKNSTKKEIESVLGDKLPKLVNKDDRVFIFFSGHGETRKTIRGRLGYLVPSDGDVDTPHASYISMRQISDYSELIPSKQILFVIDACYSGVVGRLFKGKQIKETRKQVEIFINSGGRQILTAGTSSEKAAMSKKWENHSVFTYYFLQGLKGHADYNKDEVISVRELQLFLESEVPKESNQHPQIFHLGTGEGQFIFYREDSF